MKSIILAVIILATSVAQAEEIRVIPSDWENYTYSEQQSFKDDPIHQMNDETYSEAVSRDMDLNGDNQDFELYNRYGITGEE